jgi:PhnB protein
VDPVPREYRGAVPYLNVRNGWRAVEFYKKAFSAEEVISFDRQGAKLAHAELRIGEAVFMVRDEYPEYNFLSPETIGGTPVNLLIYVPDLRDLAARAVAAGAQVIRPIAAQFHGDLMIELKDPFGHSWFFATRVKNMTIEDTRRAAADAKL